jgi:hypothetical protein
MLVQLADQLGSPSEVARKVAYATVQLSQVEGSTLIPTPRGETQ